MLYLATFECHSLHFWYCMSVVVISDIWVMSMVSLSKQRRVLVGTLDYAYFFFLKFLIFLVRVLSFEVAALICVTPANVRLQFMMI